MWRTFKAGRQLIAGIALATTLIAFVNSTQFDLLKLAFRYWDPVEITQFRLKRLSTEEFKAAIEQSLADGEIEDAQDLVELAGQYGHSLPGDLVERTHENGLQYGFRYGSDFLNGALTGEFTSFPSIAGMMAADYVGVGDVRDITIQGAHFMGGEDYDKLTMGMALVGLVTIVPGSGPVDAGASIVKTANKAGRLSKSLASQLRRIAGDLIDTKALKEGLSSFSMPKMKMPSATAVTDAIVNIDWSLIAKGDFSSVSKIVTEAIPVDTKAARSAFSRAIRPKAVQDAKELVSSAGTIASAGGLKATFAVLGHADDARELSRFSKLANAMGRFTAPAVKLLGKGAILLGELTYLLITVVFGAVSWFLGVLWTLWSVIGILRRAVA